MKKMFSTTDKFKINDENIWISFSVYNTMLEAIPCNIALYAPTFQQETENTFITHFNDYQCRLLAVSSFVVNFISMLIVMYIYKNEGKQS